MEDDETVQMFRPFDSVESPCVCHRREKKREEEKKRETSRSGATMTTASVVGGGRRWRAFLTAFFFFFLSSILGRGTTRVRALYPDVDIVSRKEALLLREEVRWDRQVA